MDSNIQRLLTEKIYAENIIKNEKLNIFLYEKEILEIVNKNMIRLQSYYEYIDTVEKFSEYTKQYKLKDIEKIEEHRLRHISYEFKYNDKIYSLQIPLKYTDIDDLLHLLVDDNYSKFSLYEIEGYCHSLIGYFNSINEAIESISKEEK